MVATATEKVGQMQTKSPSVVETLRAARKLIEKPESWTQGNYAKDSEGWSASVPWGDDAVCYCSAGAIYSASRSFGTEGAALAIDALRAAIGGNPNIPESSVIAWNDALDRTYPEVLAAFDHAISLAKANS